MRIAILGAGPAGLKAAYNLRNCGHEVYLFESAEAPGGLARSFDIDDQRVEIFYHFLCPGDSHLIGLIKECGLEGELHWVASEMNYFYNGTLYPFNSAKDLLTFSPLSLIDRVRLGLTALRLQRDLDPKELDKVTAKKWLLKSSGEAGYKAVWEPLISKKFHHYSDQLSMAWIWGRAHREAAAKSNRFARPLIGYLERGTQSLVDVLVTRLHQAGVELHCHARVHKVIPVVGGKYRLTFEDGNSLEADKVISTIPAPFFLDIMEGFPEEYVNRWRRFKYLSVLCLLVRTERPLSPSFWVNINDPAIPYLGAISLSRLNPHRLNLGHLTYLPQYLPDDHPAFETPSEILKKEAVKGLHRLFPGFLESHVTHIWDFKARFAQPVIAVHHLGRMMPHTTPFPGVFMTDSTQIFPEDRGVNNAFGLGDEVSMLCLKE